ncbi:MAG: redoxin domain-containing protein, partial [Nanoarchaeota archaeon]
MKKNSSILVFLVLGLLVIGGFSMVFLSNKNDGTSVNTNQQTEESNEQMTARMHPSQPSNNDMSSGGNPNTQLPGESYDEMMARMHPSQGGSASVSTDKINMDMNKIQFSSAVGQQASDFTLTQQDGSKFNLSDYKDKTVILFFNEGSMCYP